MTGPGPCSKGSLYSDLSLPEKKKTIHLMYPAIAKGRYFWVFFVITYIYFDVATWEFIQYLQTRMNSGIRLNIYL